MIASGMIDMIILDLAYHAACDHAYPVFVIFPGKESFPLDDKITAHGLSLDLEPCF